MDLSKKMFIFIIVATCIAMVTLILTIKDYLKSKEELIVSGRKKLNHRFWGSIMFTLMAIVNFFLLSNSDSSTYSVFILIGVLYTLLAISNIIEFINGDGIYKSYISIKGIKCKWNEVEAYKSQILYRETLTRDKKFLNIEITIKESKKGKNNLKEKKHTISIDFDLEYKEKVESFLSKVITE